MCERLSSLTLFGLLTVLLFSSCEDETQNNGQILIGRWEIIKGFRNQQATETLSGTYFQFGSDGKMITNLPVGPEEQVGYELGKSKIRQKTTPPVEYQILVLTDTALVLGLELRGMQFVMHFQRAAEPQPDDTPGELPPDDSIPPSDGTSPG